MATVGTEAMSAREAEVLEALGEHLTNAEIGRQLHISVRTVESHVSSLLRKLGAADRRELAVIAGAETAAATPSVSTGGFSGLPNRWTTFIGRGTEIDEIVAAVGSSRMVTLLGPGGIGKTALATVATERLAPTFNGGGAFVDLVPVSPHFVVQAVAAALGVTERPQEPPEKVVFERLCQGRTLLVLDNCEHVLETAATFARAVLEACPDTVVVATSRERLGLVGERVIVVPPLGLTTPGQDGAGSEAEALFFERATSGAAVDIDRALVADICRRLDGMPLAIELAAARSASLGVDGLLAGIDDHLRLLTSGPAGRHSSLRAVIDWSHDLLEDDERAYFRRLGVFVGSFDLAAAVAVAGDRDTVATSDIVGRLADKSLLVHGRDAAGSRWRMLETVHAYARYRLVASGEHDAIARGHLLWAAAAAHELEAALSAEGWQARFDAVADDLRAALTEAEAKSIDDAKIIAGTAAETDLRDATVMGDAPAYELARDLAHLSYARRFLVEARGHYAAAVDLAPDEPTAVAALRVSADAAYAEMRGDLAFAMLTAAYERASAHGDKALAALVLADAAMIGGRAPGTFDDPPTHEDLVALVERAQALAPADDPEVAVHVAIAAAWNGRPLPTEPDPVLANRALVLARRLDDAVLISNSLDAVASAASFAGHFREASRFTAARLDLLDRLNRHDPRVGGEVADIYHMNSETAMAAGELQAGLAAAMRAHEDSLGQGLSHFAAAHLVVPLTLLGSFDEALLQAEVMRDGWQRTGRPPAGWMAPSFFAAAMVHGLLGDEEARQEWWELAQVTSLQTTTNSFSLFAGARLALHHGDTGYVDPSAGDMEKFSAGQYSAYGAAAAVELAVVAGAPDAERRLEDAASLGFENDFVAACLLRAAGRLHNDESQLEAAVAKWVQIGARFERACTLLLLPSRYDEGTAEIAALGCTLPAA